MRRIVVTGFTREEFRKLKDPDEDVTRCYLCKRHHSKRGIWIEIGEGVSRTAHSTEMGFELISIIEERKEGAIKVCYYLCHECRLLFEAIAEKLDKGETVFTKDAK